MDERILQTLERILGQENVSDRLIDLVAYATDASEYTHRPQAAVWPRSPEEVSEVLKVASEERIPVTPRGAGTGLTGLAVPQAGGLVMDLSRMNRILELRIEDRVAVVQPGVVYQDLQLALEPHGFFFPPDPASGIVSTLGGNVACDAGGIKGAKYGTTKNYVLALQVVLADGRILTTGSRCIKSVSGYDLTQLFVGSEGTLGVITEITLKISPKPLQTSTAMAVFETLEDAGRAVGEIMRSGILPSALEIIDRQTLIAINQNTDLNLPEAEAILVAEADGQTLEETGFQIARIVAIFERNRAVEVRQGRSQAESDALWKARKSAGAVISRINKNRVVEDLAVPISRVPEMLKAIAEIGRRYELKIPTVGHAGDGNLHPAITFDSRQPGELERVEAAGAEILKAALALGGTLTGEHGIGLAKAGFMPLEHDPLRMELMRAVKRLFDPLNILNPGKMGL